MSIGRCYILNAFNVAVDLLINSFTPYWKICESEIPLKNQKSSSHVNTYEDHGNAPIMLWTMRKWSIRYLTYLSIPLPEHSLSSIICVLFGQSMVTEQVNDVMRAVLVFFSMVRDAVIGTGKD
ncbi:hypothetical protein ONS96_004914 [Cadophora gregata f. sp. sojae]|nr:hypothetical protein ONS96_004914 [Cadophora gregata f. sp. sojae]